MACSPPFRPTSHLSAAPTRACSITQLACLTLLLAAVGLLLPSPAHAQDLGIDRFARVSAGLYRGGQPSQRDLRSLKDMGIRTVVNLRRHGRKLDEERDYVERELGLKFLWFPMHAGRRVEEGELDALLRVLAAPENQPIFIHAQHGEDRTGLIVGLHRVVNEGWTLAAARREMEAFGYQDHSGLESTWRVRLRLPGWESSRRTSVYVSPVPGARFYGPDRAVSPLPAKDSLIIHTYNINVLADQTGTMNREMARYFNEHQALKPDIVLWQEVKGNTSESSPERLFADRLGDYYSRHISKKGRREGQGSSIISRFPFRAADYKVFDAKADLLGIGNVLPLADAERVMIVGEFEVPRLGLVRAVSLHLAHMPYMGGTRVAQIREVLAWVEQAQRARPAAATILAGDFNSTPGSAEYRTILQHGQQGQQARLDFQFHGDPQADTGSLGRRLDSIFIASDRLRFVEERILWTGAMEFSDHAGVWQKFEIVPDRPAVAATSGALGATER